MKRPRIVWVDSTAAGGDTIPARPRRSPRHLVRVAIVAGVLVVEFWVFYIVLSSIGGTDLAMPVLLAMSWLAPIRNRMTGIANRLAHKLVPDHFPENTQGVSSRP